MPSQDPIPPSLQRTADAWTRYKRLMSWMAIAAVVAVLLALIYLKSSGRPVPIHRGASSAADTISAPCHGLLRTTSRWVARVIAT